jgi:thymidylate synthase
MRQYLDLMADILANGVVHEDRTGVGRQSVFGRQLRFDLADGFPLVTTKRIHFKSVAAEILWFLRGETNVRWLREQGVTIWDEWADDAGELGPITGKQWRFWQAPDGRTIDQISWVVSEIRKNPNSSRLVVSAWNPADVEATPIPPCPSFFQFSAVGGRLHCHLYQRSADMFLGVPFNIAGQALLLSMVAQVTGYPPGELIHSFGDAHIYLTHLKQAQRQLERTPRRLPHLELNAAVADILAFGPADISISGYDPHSRIAAPVAV